MFTSVEISDVKTFTNDVASTFAPKLHRQGLAALRMLNVRVPEQGGAVPHHPAGCPVTAAP